MKKIFFWVVIFSMLLSACDATSAPPTKIVLTETPSGDLEETSATETSAPLTKIELGAGHGARNSWFELYFTDPESPLASQRTGGVDAPLVAAIDSARLSVDVAIYSLSLNSIRNALINAHERGVRVRMVMESENLDRSDPERIKDAGIPILGDRQQGLMHDKFVVIDGYEVWLGSMNLTDSGAYTDNNHIMRIRSTQVAENYIKEFEEMFNDDMFGANVVAETPNPTVTIDGTQLDIYFSPDDGVLMNLLSLVESAEESIFFMAFSFTTDDLGELMRAKAEEGISVYGVMEEEQVKSNIGTEYDIFKQAGLNVRLDGNEGQMHHKVIIIDQRIVVTGSYNFSNSAETRNDETVMVIYNEEIAAYFVDEFQKIYQQGK